MKIIYTAGPITTDHANYRWQFHMVAREYAFKIWQKGHVALCPHMNTMFMDDPSIPAGVFYEGDLEMIRRCCDGMLMLPGWRDSKGSVKELEEAEKLGIKIFYYNAIEALWEYLAEQEVVNAAH